MGKLRGQFRLWPGEKKELLIPNTIVDEGEEAFLKMLMQGDNTIVAAGGNFYLGLCPTTPAEAHDLTSLSEPAAGGYARQSVARNTTGFPTVDQVGGMFRAVSALVTFTATGADYDIAIDRAFLCNVSTGTAGILFAYSGALATPITLLDGETLPMQYELYLD